MQQSLKNIPISFPVEPPGIIRINNELYTEETLPQRGIKSIDVETLDPDSIQSVYDETFETEFDFR